MRGGADRAQSMLIMCLALGLTGLAMMAVAGLPSPAMGYVVVSGLIHLCYNALLVRMFGLRLDRAWAERRHGSRFFRRLWGELRTLEWLGAARRDADGWTLTERGMYWLMLMMSAFFEAVNAYREAMRAHVREELATTNR